MTARGRKTRGAAGLLSAAMSCLPGVAWPDAGLVSFTFDDASRTQYELGFPVTQAHGIRGTLFVVTEDADEATREVARGKAAAEDSAEGDAAAYVPTSWAMTWDEIRQLRDAGWEIGSHTHTHPHLPELDHAQVIREMETALARIEAETGVTAVSFAPPYGDFSEETLDLAMDRHAYHLLALGQENNGHNPVASVDPARIDRFGVYNWTAPGSVCREMARTEARKTWLVVMFHGFSEGAPGDYEIRVDALRDIMACARALEDGGHIRVAPVAEAMNLIRGTTAAPD